MQSHKTMLFMQGSGDMIADRRFTWAQEFYERGEYLAAAELMAEASHIAPQWPPGLFRCGEFWAKVEQHEKAIDAFQRYLKTEPHDVMGATLWLARLGAEPIPDTMPHAYVEALFDAYAPKFEDHLLKKLKYSVPQIMADLLQARFGKPSPRWRVLDLGCGTGLAGVQLKPWALWLEGADISSNMALEARRKNIYDRVQSCEILEALQYAAAQKFDMIVAADVLIYIGELGRFFETARTALHDHGYLMLSLQTAPHDEDITLGKDMRYSHSPRYLQDCAHKYGYEVLELRHDTIRQEAGADVAGMIALMKPSMPAKA